MMRVSGFILLFLSLLTSPVWADGWKIMRGSSAPKVWTTAVDGQPICGDDVNLLLWASTDVDDDGTQQICDQNIARVNQSQGLVRTDDNNQIAVEQLAAPTPFNTNPPIGACRSQQHTWIDEGQLTKLKFGGCPGGGGENVITDLYVNKIDSVCLDVNCENLPDGEYGTLAFQGAGSVSRVGGVITVVKQEEHCERILNPDATDDKLFTAFTDAVDITQVWCQYEAAVAPATIAQFRLEDGSATLLTHTTPVCAGPASIPTRQTVTGSLIAGKLLRFDVLNTPTAAHNYLLCVSYERSALQ